MTTRFYEPIMQALDASGVSINGAKLEFFDVGTSNQRATYRDSLLTVPNTNPIIADGAGRFPDIFLERRTYTVILTDADDVVLWSSDVTADNVTLDQAQAEAYIWCGTASGTADAIILLPLPALTALAAGQRLVWIAGASDNTGAMTIEASTLPAVAAQNDGAALNAGDHAAGKLYQGFYDGAQFQIERIRITPAATQAQQEAGTDNTIFVSPANQQFHQSAAKAWAINNMSASIIDSFNVSSITDVALARFSINLNNNMTNANYPATSSAEASNTTRSAINTIETMSTSAIPYHTEDENSVASETNITSCSVIAMGDLA